MKEIIERRSIRKYKAKDVSKKGKLLDHMESGLIRERNGNKLLPNSQYGLPDAFNTLRIMREAPVLIVIENTNGISPYVEINADDRVTEICDTLSIGASVQNILLTATELGYGTLWIANTCFAYNELVDFIDIKGQLVGAISLGIANETPASRPRKDFVDVVEFR